MDIHNFYIVASNRCYYYIISIANTILQFQINIFLNIKNYFYFKSFTQENKPYLKVNIVIIDKSIYDENIREKNEWKNACGKKMRLYPQWGGENLKLEKCV